MIISKILSLLKQLGINRDIYYATFLYFVIYAFSYFESLNKKNLYHVISKYEPFFL